MSDPILNLSSFQDIVSYISGFAPIDDPTGDGMTGVTQGLTDYDTNTLTPAVEDFNSKFSDSKKHLEQYIATVMSDLQTEIYGLSTGELVFVKFVNEYFNNTGACLYLAFQESSCDPNFGNALIDVQSLSSVVIDYFNWIISQFQNMLTKMDTISEELISKTQIFAQKIIVLQKITDLNKIPNIDVNNIQGLTDLSNIGSQLGDTVENVLNGTYTSSDQLINDFKSDMINYKTNFKDWVLNDFILGYKTELSNKVNQFPLPSCTNINSKFTSLYNDLQNLHDTQETYFNDLA